MQIERIEIDGRRHYKVVDNSKLVGVFPSVTSILSETSDKSSLNEWILRVGEKEAERISTLSMNRGTVMHRLIELYKPLIGSKEQKLIELKKTTTTDKEISCFEKKFIDEGWDMFMKFYFNSQFFFDRIDHVMEAETFLWSKIGYAGTVDNVSQTKDGKILVIDYKNSRKAKKEQWVEDYYLQISAYYVAYWQRTRIKAHGAEIWIANEEDSRPQIFELTQNEIQYYFNKFQKRLSEYKLKFKN